MDGKSMVRAAKRLWGAVIFLSLVVLGSGVYIAAPIADGIVGDPNLKLTIEGTGVAVIALGVAFLFGGFSVLTGIYDKERIEQQLESMNKTLGEVHEATVKPDADLMKVMEEFSKFLQANRKEIVDFIEGNQRPIAIGDNAFAKTVQQVMTLIPLDAKTWDKAHYELSIAVIEAFWCGWLSGAKASDGRYPKDYPQRFAKAIETAFAAGQTYAKERK